MKDNRARKRCEYDDTQVEQWNDHGAFHHLNLEGDQQKIQRSKIGYTQEQTTEDVSDAWPFEANLNLV